MSFLYATKSGGGGGGPTIVDNFEDNDIAEYTGDTGSFTTQTGTVFNGSYALEGTTSSGDALGIHSTSGLDTYPAQGNTFRVNIYHTTSGDLNGVLYGHQGGDQDYYLLRPHDGTQEFQLYSNVSGTGFTKLASAAVDPPLNEWMEMEVAWGTDDTHDCKLFDAAGNQIASLSATDGTFTSGGIGFEVNNSEGGTTGYFDYERIV